MSNSLVTIKFLLRLHVFL